MAGGGGGWGGYDEGSAGGAPRGGSGTFSVDVKCDAIVSGTATCTFDDWGDVSMGPFGSCSCSGYDKSCTVSFSDVAVSPNETYNWSGTTYNKGGPYGGSFSLSFSSIKYLGCTSEITSDCVSRGLDYAKDKEGCCACTNCSASVIAACGSKGTKIVQNAEGKSVCVCATDCTEGGPCRTDRGVKGTYDNACQCQPSCEPGEDCSIQGKTGKYTYDCECEGECEEEKECSGGGEWKGFPTCACDCTNASPGEYECTSVAGGTFDKTLCACKCEDGRILSSGETCGCTAGGDCRTAEGVKGTYSASCVCVALCTPGEKCDDTTASMSLGVNALDTDSVPSHTNKDCECVPDCTPGSSCTVSDEPGQWVIKNGECVCETCRGAECRTDEGVFGHKNVYCQCIADCSEGGTCTTKVGDADVPGKYDKDCKCVADCTPGGDCTAEIEEGVTAPGTYDNQCKCNAKCTPGEACDMGGGKTGAYDADCNCKCYGLPCAMGTEGGALDTNCDCQCINADGTTKVGTSCTIGEGEEAEEGKVNEECNCECAAKGQYCSYGSLGGTFDENCDCKCSAEVGSVCSIGEEPGAGVVTEDCNCECSSKGAPCDIGGRTGVGEIDANCECQCVDEGEPCDIGGKTAAGTVNSACECECNEKGAPCDKTSLGDGEIGADCECHCSGEEEAKAACEETSEQVWNDNHTWNDSTCNCDCSEKSLTECDPLYGDWDPESCGCTCIEGAEDACEDDKHHFEAYPYCKCKCNDTVAENNCISGETPGTWDDLDCKCECPYGATLVDGKCVCDEDKKEDCIASAGEEAWTPATCTCCTNRDTREKLCDGSATTFSGDAPGTWNDDRCECECKSPHVRDGLSCKCDGDTKSKCPTSKGATFDKSTCKCKCNSSSLIKLKEACQTTEAQESGASWDESTCSCKCASGREFNGTSCECGPEYARKKSDCQALATNPTYEASWNETYCRCDCNPEKTKGVLCDLPNGGHGKYTENCECECVDAGKSCGNIGMKYTSECKCVCPASVVGTKCTITAGKTEVTGKKDNHCLCQCNTKPGTECTTSKGYKGRTNSSCECECNDSSMKAGSPCKLGEDPVTHETIWGKYWTDCSCVCKDAGSSCSNPYGKPGGVGYIEPQSCECKCAPDGTRCILATGNIGKSKNCYCEACDDSDAKNCTDKGGYWKWNPTGCKCDCGITAASCAAMDPPRNFDKAKCECGDCVPIQCDPGFEQDPETCECTECQPDSLLCLGAATLNEKTCKCECKENTMTKCESGKHHSPEMGCQCVCDGDVDNCADGQVWNELKCKCVCDKATVMQTLGPDYCQHGHLDDDCKCVCDSSSSDCNENQMWNENKCQCECKFSDTNCPNGQHQDEQCNCVCDQDESMCAPDIQVWDAQNCKCVCNPDAFQCEQGKHLNDECICVCEQTAENNNCDPVKEYFDDTTCGCVCYERPDCPDGMDSKCECNKCADNPSCASGQLSEYPDCKCICTSEQQASCKTPDKGGNYAMDSNCNCYCNLSASTCLEQNKTFEANSCSCICSTQCSDPSLPDLDAETCTCMCDPARHGGPDCEGRGFDYSTCSCKKCKKEEQPKKSECQDESCSRFDEVACEWVCATEEWDAKKANFTAGLAEQRGKVDSVCASVANIPATPSPSTLDIACCYNSNENAISKLKEEVSKNRNAAQEICNTVKDYLDDLKDLESEASELECPDAFPSIPSAPSTSGVYSYINAATNNVKIIQNVDNCTRYKYNPDYDDYECI